MSSQLTNLSQHRGETGWNVASSVFGHDNGWLFALAIALIPLDSFPLFFIQTENRPMCFLPLFAYICVSIFRLHRFPRQILWVVLLVIYGNLVAVANGVFRFYTLDFLSKSVFTSVITIITFLAALQFFQQVLQRHSYADVALAVTAALLYGCILHLIVGYLQILGMLSILPLSLTQRITMLFSYRGIAIRLQGISGEPAQGGRYLAVAFFMIRHFRDRFPRSGIWQVLIAVAMIFSGSALVYLSVLLILVGRPFVSFLSLRRNQLRRNTGNRFIVIVPVIIIIAVGASQFLPAYTIDRLESLGRIFTSFPGSFGAIIRADGSLFLRIINPWIGLTMPFRGYPMGTGFETYHLAYRHIIPESFSYAMNYYSVAKTLEGASIITPKSMYAKYAAEMGIIGYIAVLWYLFTGYVTVRYSTNENTRKLNVLLFVMSAVIILNRDSYFYFNFVLILVLFLFGGRTEQTNVETNHDSIPYVPITSSEQ